MQVCPRAKFFLREAKEQALGANSVSKSFKDTISVLLPGLAHGKYLICEDLPYGPGTSQKTLKVRRVSNTSMDLKDRGARKRNKQILVKGYQLGLQ
jgi:hypothetical protein